jgi:DnaJ family protein C protein 13
VIWNAHLRRQVVELIDAHIGAYPSRLRQHTFAKYEYVPLPKIHFPELDKEIYVHEYYLRNLCDEVRFPNWPVVDPLLLLREVIQRWREEMSKGVVDNTVTQAKKLMELPAKYTNADLRKAYKNLARQYHPDKNPNGREMFEKIQVAYELLSKVELKETETNMVNVLHLLKTQNLIYRRFAEAVAPQKYPVYPLLVSILTVPPLEPPVEGIDAEILLAGTLLMFHTSNISPLNAKEFVKVGAMTKLHEIIQYAIRAYDIPGTAKLASDLLLYGMKAATAIAHFDAGRDALMAICPKFAEDIVAVIELDKKHPVACENAIEVVSRASQHAGLQQCFVDAGVVWQLVPMLMGYDGTLQEDYSDETQRILFNQTAANVHAVLAAKTLGRLGGVMFDEFASPPNEEVKDALKILLTQPLMKLLRNRRPWELLGSLNENCEKATKIWNVGMRKELLDFVLKIRKTRPAGCRTEDLKPTTDFSFAALREELCVGGVYVRIFNKNGDTNDVDDPSQFCRDLVAYIWSYQSSPTIAASVSNAHQEQSIEGLKVLARAHDYIPVDIANCPNGLLAVFGLLSRPSDSAALASAAELMSILCNSPDFIVLACASSVPVAWMLLQACCTCSGQYINFIWQAAELFSSHPDGLRTLVDIGSIPHMLSLIFGVAGYANAFANRLSAISLLSKCLSNPVKGQEASAMLRRCNIAALVDAFFA